MRFFRIFSLSFVLFSISACDTKGPLAPAMPLSIKVKVPVDPSLRPSLLSSTSDRLLYVVRDSSGVQMSGSVGPFVALTGAGLYTLNLDNVPVGNGAVLSVQLNDASTAPETPLAVGAMSLDGSVLTAGNLTLELGSIARNCYNTVVPNYSDFEYSFLSDAVTFGGLLIYDLRGSTPITPPEHTLYSQTGQTLAYMGNGDLVDFAYVPPSGQFFADSMAAKGGATATGDVFCVRLLTMPGHAWIQIIDPGEFNNNGPHFRFRVNTTLPYYAYERLPLDITSACSGAW